MKNSNLIMARLLLSVFVCVWASLSLFSVPFPSVLCLSFCVCLCRRRFCQWERLELCTRRGCGHGACHNRPARAVATSANSLACLLACPSILPRPARERSRSVGFVHHDTCPDAPVRARGTSLHTHSLLMVVPICSRFCLFALWLV